MEKEDEVTYGLDDDDEEVWNGEDEDDDGGEEEEELTDDEETPEEDEDEEDEEDEELVELLIVRMWTALAQDSSHLLWWTRTAPSTDGYNPFSRVALSLSVSSQRLSESRRLTDRETAQSD